jgi:hypothetical protein
VIVEMEQRLAQMAAIFDPKALGLEAVSAAPAAAPAEVFDPNATTADSAGRQAVADQIFG